MPIRKPKPTSPGRRFVYVSRLRGDHEDRAGEVARRGPQEVRRPQRARPQDRPPPRRRRQAAATARSTSSAARTASRPRSPRSSTTPTAPPTSRCCTTSTARSATSSRRARLRVGATVQSGPRRRDHASATACRWRNMPTGTVVHNVELQPGRGGQLGRSAGTGIQLHGEGGRHGHAAPALGRDAHGPRRVPRDGRHDRQRRPPERQGRQGRPQAPHGRAPADARHRHEPGRPPARRRRGLDHRRAATR